MPELNKSIVEEAALEWFGELGYALGHGPHRAPSEPATEWDSFGEAVQSRAEIIHSRVDAAKPNLGLTNWRGAVIRKPDVSIAENYLSEREVEALNNLVEQYLIFAQGQAMRLVPMHMADWIEKLNGFLSLNDRAVLTHAGRISHAHQAFLN